LSSYSVPASHTFLHLHFLSLLVFCFFFFFFFSSRRRHTRCLSDWSSDVCSSDLAADRRDPGDGDSYSIVAYEPDPAPDALRLARSEERRVGKECRSRWSPDD